MSEKIKVEEGKIEQISLDPENANMGTERGRHLLETSLRRNGAGRSIVLDKNKRAIGGNKTTEEYAAIGGEDVVFVHTDGTKLVAVVRDDLDLEDDPEGRARELALADNRVAEVDLAWSAAQLAQYAQEGVAVEEYFFEDELAALAQQVQLTEPAEQSEPSDDKKIEARRTLTERFGVPPFSVLDARQGYWQERKRAWLALGIKSELGRDGNLSSNPIGAHDGGPGLLIDGYRREEAGKTSGGEATSATSVFDPVLCECIYRWFSPQNARVLDPFAGGSVRGVVAALLGRDYTGYDLRSEQIAANRQQWHEISKQDIAPEPEQEITDPDALTPVEKRGAYFFKRDDLFAAGLATGGKGRSLLRLARNAKGLVASGSRQSTQLSRAAQVAAYLGIPCRVHTASGPHTTEMVEARKAGAEIIQHKPGYLSVCIKRAEDDALEHGYALAPWGLICHEAVEETARQVENLPEDTKRLVVPVGGGASLAGILRGMKRYGLNIAVLGVCVGKDPEETLDRMAPSDWRSQVTLVRSELPYEQAAPQTVLEGVPLDPIYEAKCIPFMEEGDLLWVVACRSSAKASENAPLVPSLASNPVPPAWVVADSREALTGDLSQTYDLVFSCPPYEDLEVYSDSPKDLSTMKREEFLKAYQEIITGAVKALKSDRFACFVVGEVRGKEGFCRGLVQDTIRFFEEAGARLYNDAILLTVAGSLPIRAGRQFNAGRKLGRTHQSVLIFCKGDPKKAVEVCGVCEFDLSEESEE